jgi:hypothetical protein
MIRNAAAVMLLLCFSASSLSAQTAEIKVNTTSADVHKGPSASSPVIGRAPRGAVLEVTRELGDWVKVTWPGAEDGSGYVFLRPGTISRNGIAAMPPSSTFASPSTSAEVPAEPDQLAPAPVYVAPPTHFVGLGARFGTSSPGFGGTARFWGRGHLGGQFEASREVATTPTLPERRTLVQFAPSVLYCLDDRVSDDVWVRPYFGGGVSFYRSSLSLAPGVDASVTSSKLGYQAFGGGEVTFPSVPRLAVSADLGYRWLQTPWEGYELDGFVFTLSAHWYVK